MNTSIITSELTNQRAPKALFTYVVYTKYILLDVLLCSIAEYFYELYRILTRPTGESRYKQRVKILSDTIQQNV